MTKPLLGNRNINQLAFVVKDIESANEAFTKLLGPIRLYGHDIDI